VVATARLERLKIKLLKMVHFHLVLYQIMVVLEGLVFIMTPGGMQPEVGVVLQDQDLQFNLRREELVFMILLILVHLIQLHF
jgi:hypothetical protein